MLRYAKSKRGSKSKRKGAKNTGTKVQTWRYCNPANLPRYQLKGEYVNPENDRKYANGATQHRGHMHLPGCDCLARRDWDDNYSEEYIAMQHAAKQHAKRVKAHQDNGAQCASCHTLLSLSGECINCD